MSLDTRIVLVGTTDSGNIGAAARAMKTMGLTDLVLVAPACEIDQKARARAAGALDLLDEAAVHADLAAAVADCDLVAGATARTRKLGAEPVTPRTCAERIAGREGSGRAAVVFGRERTGLTNEELELCQLALHIPANPDYSSLNVAMAVQVIAYELRLAAGSGELPEPAGLEHPAATTVDLERLYEHLERVLLEIGFLDPEHPRQLMRRLRRLFGRAGLDRNELNILRGILSAVEGKGSAPRRKKRSEQ